MSKNGKNLSFRRHETFISQGFFSYKGKTQNLQQFGTLFVHTNSGNSIKKIFLEQNPSKYFQKRYLHLEILSYFPLNRNYPYQKSLCWMYKFQRPIKEKSKY